MRRRCTCNAWIPSNRPSSSRSTLLYYLSLTCELSTLPQALWLALSIGIGRVRRNDVTDPTQGTARAYPEPWCDNEPEECSQELAVVDLPYSRNKGAQHCRSTGVFHGSLTHSDLTRGSQAEHWSGDVFPSAPSRQPYRPRLCDYADRPMGSRIVNIVPLPGSLWTLIDPWWFSMMR
jgi:uncharacterized protein YceK